MEYKGKRYTGYKSLLACLQRALDEGIPATTPRFWVDESCSDETWKHVFRSATEEEIPLLAQRIAILRESGQVLHQVRPSLLLHHLSKIAERPGIRRGRSTIE